MAAEKMAESLLIRASVEVSFQKIISAATQLTNLVFGEDHQDANFLNNLMKNLFSQSSQEETNLVKAIREEVKNLKVSLSKVQDVSVGKLEPQEKAEIIKLWMQKLGDLAYDADDALAEFEYGILHSHVLMQNQAKGKAAFPSSVFYYNAFRAGWLPRVRGIITKLEVINKEVQEFQIPEEFASPTVSCPRQKVASLIVDQRIIGREEDTTKIVQMLTAPRNEVLSVFSVVGSKGVGKTRLAESVCNDQRVMKIFERIIWVDGCGAFKIKGLLKLILEALGQKVVAEEKIKAMVQRLEEELGNNRFLIVIDDLQKVKPDKWEDLKQKLGDISKVSGSTILVIAQNEQDAANVSSLESHVLVKLSPAHCWSIIKDKVNSDGEQTRSLDLEDIGRQMAEKCQGLPLAANILGGLLQSKEKKFWLSILESGVLDAENIVSEVLKLIFEYLPSPSLQRCFAFISMLPRDSVMERMQLVQLWMAEGFLDSGTSSYVLEEVGNQYFDVLLHCSLIQAVTKDKFNKITHCKMHNLVHDFASSISRFDSISFDGSVKNEVPQIKHLALESFKNKKMKILEENAKHLRTLFLKSNVPEDVLLEFNTLHVLNLSGVDIEELPSFLDDLTQLQYLDLSGTKINSLPDSVCKLYKLQTLRVTECGSLEGFPENFKNLLSLRHLHFYNEHLLLPSEIRRLTNLQTLPMYNIDDTRGPRIGELKGLKNLQGKLEIHHLDLVKDKEEAEQADLFGKSNLQELKLHWSSSSEDENNDENVLDGLQPHPNLRSLVVEGFRGERFSSWVMNMSVCVSQGGRPLRLDNLTEVELTNCEQLLEIPALGLLPRLHHLVLRGLCDVACIGPSFYEGNGSRRSEIGGHISKSFFPELRSLTINDLEDLEYWKGVEETSSTNDEVELFPRLERLSILGCMELTTAPSQFPSLKELNIECIDTSSPLESICSEATTLTNLRIHGIDGLTCLPDGLLQNNPNLARLHIEDCESLERIVSDILCCGTFLEELVIRNCKNLQQLPEDLFVSLQSLEMLEISNCPELQSLPTSNGHEGLTSLCSLTISECTELTNIPSELVESCRNLQVLRVNDSENLSEFSVDLRKTPYLSSFLLFGCPELDFPLEELWELKNLITLQIGPLQNSSEFEAFQTCLRSIQNLSSLHHLTLVGKPEWDSLPDVLQHLPTLKQLSLHCFGMESLPDWIEKLSSLQELNLYSCKNLQYFPSREIMKRLKKLRKLTIKKCPQLWKRWSERDAQKSEWSKVSHIPQIFSNDVEVEDPELCVV